MATLDCQKQQQDGFALEHASKELQAELVKKDPTIRTLSTWIKNPVPLKDAPEEMKNNLPIVMAAVQQDYCAIEFASNGMKNNEKVVLKAIASERKRWPNDPADLSMKHASKRVQHMEHVRKAAGM